MTTLYKLDSKGKLRVWQIETKGAKILQHAGLLDGKLVTNEKTCTSKNVGRSNETSPEAQAVMEMKSEILSKLDEGYFRTQTEAENTRVVLPMLAKSYNDEKKKIDWDEVFVQPKLDGMRCLAFIDNGSVELISRDGKVITTVPHIVEALSKIKDKVILDGELYAHGKNFQENMRLIKKHREGESEAIQYNIYDCVDDTAFAVRYITAADLITEGKIKHCKLVETFPIEDEKELKDYHKKFLGDGYEGTILRWGNEKYKVNGRSSNLLKFKDFIDIAAKIIDIEPAEQRPEWGVPVLELNKYCWIYESGEIVRVNDIQWAIANCKVKWGKPTFRAGMKYSHDERKEFLTNKKNYIGKTAEIRFFEYSEDGVPRFPVMVGVRLDK